VHDDQTSGYTAECYNTPWMNATILLYHDRLDLEQIEGANLRQPLCVLVNINWTRIRECCNDSAINRTGRCQIANSRTALDLFHGSGCCQTVVNALDDIARM
jgi:hypothetical protein